MIVTEEEPNWSTAEELAKELRVSTRTVLTHTRSGRIPYIKVGSQYRYNLQEVKAALSSTSDGDQ